MMTTNLTISNSDAIENDHPLLATVDCVFVIDVGRLSQCQIIKNKETKRVLPLFLLIFRSHLRLSLNA